jgi:hypothetical protein
MPRPGILSESTQRAVLQSIENPELTLTGFTKLCRAQPNVFGHPSTEKRKGVSSWRRDRIKERKSRPLVYVSWCIRYKVEVSKADTVLYAVYQTQKKVLTTAVSASQPEPTQQTFDSPDDKMTPSRPKRSPLCFDDPLDDIHDVEDDDFDDNKDKYGKSTRRFLLNVILHPALT